MNVKITKIYRTDKKKDGTPLIGAKGPYTKCSIMTEQHGEKWVGGFGNKTTDSWTVGQEVEINVVEKDGYLNFELPKKNEIDTRALQFIQDDMQAIKTEMVMIRTSINDMYAYMKANQVMVGKNTVTNEAPYIALSGNYPYPTPTERVAQLKNNHFAGGLGYTTDDRGAPLPTDPDDINPDDIPF